MSARAAAALEAVCAAIRAADALLDPADRAAFNAQLFAELAARRKGHPAPTGGIDTIAELAARHGAAMRAARKRSGGA
jgi:hypothetical protein